VLARAQLQESVRSFTLEGVHLMCCCVWHGGSARLYVSTNYVDCGANTTDW